ncbi:MAG: LON peptidase substrate-binding domain-containing protein [Planctomycetota bacterium]|nr:LON peptidase substrate-binding domain-containing protein [Planctomycetota bacterium]MDA1113690.1 LON peptidase substrate-binding domain-containing protein [Planctomycetota bacterium]
MSQLLPVFPLPNLILYPGSLVPLHLFEPRYLKMLEDMLAAKESDLIAGTLLPGWEEGYFESPALYPVAGVGKVQQVRKDEAGNFNLVLRGIQRVRIVSEPERDEDAMPYRKVLAEPLHEEKVSGADAPKEADALILALQALSGGAANHAIGKSLNYLADVLLVQLPLNMQKKLDLFAEVDARARAQAVLQAWADLHRGELPPPATPGPNFRPDSN